MTYFPYPSVHILRHSIYSDSRIGTKSGRLLHRLASQPRRRLSSKQALAE